MKDGILILNKPQNWTSSDCVALCRRALRCKGIKKVGHGGTLDPMATGVLPIFVGQATRIMEYLDLDNKTYRCTAQLGMVTDTLDIWGELLERRSFADVREADVIEGLKSFEGWIQQTPPKYSAVRINGKRLYEYAYKGQEIDVDITKRNVNISKIDVISMDMAKGAVTFDITCSKGTYVRTVCHDLGEKLDCGCVMTALERTKVGNIGLGLGLPVISPLEIKARLAEIGNERDGASEVDRRAAENEAFAAELEAMFLDADYPLVHFGKLALTGEGVSLFSRGNYIPWTQARVLSEPDVAYMQAQGRDGTIAKNARGRSYDRIYSVYSAAGEFLGTGYYDREKGLLKADKVFIEQR